VIGVPVGFEQELNLAIGDLSDERFDLVGQGRELVIDQEGAVFPCTQPEVPASALEDVEAIGQLRALELDLVEVLGNGELRNQQQSR